MSKQIQKYYLTPKCGTITFYKKKNDSLLIPKDEYLRMSKSERRGIIKLRHACTFIELDYNDILTTIHTSHEITSLTRSLSIKNVLHKNSLFRFSNPAWITDKQILWKYGLFSENLLDLPKSLLVASNENELKKNFFKAFEEAIDLGLKKNYFEEGVVRLVEINIEDVVLADKERICEKKKMSRASYLYFDKKINAYKYYSQLKSIEKNRVDLVYGSIADAIDNLGD